MCGWKKKKTWSWRNSRCKWQASVRWRTLSWLCRAENLLQCYKDGGHSTSQDVGHAEITASVQDCPQRTRRMWLTPRGMWGLKKKARRDCMPNSSMPFLLSLWKRSFVPHYRDSEREEGGEGHRQKGSASLLSGATETGELRLSWCSLLFPKEEWGMGQMGRFRPVSFETVFLLGHWTQAHPRETKQAEV